MTRKPLLITLLSIVLLAASAAAAPPFGSFSGLPGGRNAGSGFLPLTGWALDDNGIARVEVWVDGQPAGTAFYGFARPDVLAVHPGYPDSRGAGFGFELDTSLYLNGLHSVAAYAFSRTGERVKLEEYVYEFLNTTHLLVPFGAIDVPHASTELFGNCDVSDPTRRYSVVYGWSLDTGVELGDTGVKYVELLINGALYANTVTDCFYSPVIGWTNCYGLPRPEIKNRYSTVANGLHSGFRFVLDIGALIDFGFNEGFHELTVRVGDYAGGVANVAEIPVVFICDDHVGNEGAFGLVDLPQAYGIYGGRVKFYGWALDWEGVNRIHILFDGAEIGLATYGIPRPEISLIYPGFPDSAAPGWEFEIDTARYNDGRHNLAVVVEDDLGARTIVGEVDFTFDSLYGGGTGK